MRVAVGQCAIGADLDQNLASCQRLLDAAAAVNADLVVLPEFSNHLSWYEDQAHCYSVSLELDGEWLQAIAAKAKQINAYVVVNCTLRREQPSCTGTSLLYSPQGELLASSDKQVLIGHENDFLQKAAQPGPIVDTEFGRLGLYACMDGVINETPRCLALRGGQLLCNSLNSFATDEGSLHIPVRAAENKVFVAAANKVGPLIPEAIIEPVSQETGIPVSFLMGAGESQIVAPDGTVLARASLDQEEVVFADIELSEADNKLRPDGTDIFETRRPALYQALAQDPAGQELSCDSAETAQAALIQLSRVGADAPAEAGERIAAAFAAGAQLLVLPPLFFLEQQQVVDVAAAREDSQAMIDFLASCCGTDQYLATSMVLGEPAQLCAVLIGERGLVLQQGQMHKSERYSWSALVDRVESCDLGFSRLALLTSDDACLPESFRLAALAGADTVIVPSLALEQWELDTGLLERSAENRVNLLAAAQASELGNSMATSLTRDFTVLTPWKERAFDGLLSQPPVFVADSAAGATHIEIHPRCAENKVVSRGTDLLAGRPWQLLEPICGS
ncbi:MAG: nitrilase-related carbon-nitrogen hydrolase [Halieaceae bacterium]